MESIEKDLSLGKIPPNRLTMSIRSDVVDSSGATLRAFCSPERPGSENKFGHFIRIDPWQLRKFDSMTSINKYYHGMESFLMLLQIHAYVMFEMFHLRSFFSQHRLESFRENDGARFRLVEYVQDFVNTQILIDWNNNKIKCHCRQVADRPLQAIFSNHGKYVPVLLFRDFLEQRRGARRYRAVHCSLLSRLGSHCNLPEPICFRYPPADPMIIS